MGGCATKPKANAAEAPLPEPAKEDASGLVSEAKEVAVSEEVEKIERESTGTAAVDEEEKEIVVDEIDEHGNKRRSLSNLFKENEGKEPTEHDKTQSEPVKQEEAAVNEIPIDTEPDESGKGETPVEQTPREVEEALVEAKAEKAVEVAPVIEALAEEVIEAPAATESQKPEEEMIVKEKFDAETKKTEEKKEVVEDKPATEN